MILLTNSASNLRILGTLNGFATSLSAIGRAFGPAMSGALFTWGVNHDYIITPWWALGVIAALGAIPIWYIKETDGFGNIDVTATSEEEAEEGGSDAQLLVFDEEDSELSARDRS
jgi:hypothetical protein